MLNHSVEVELTVPFGSLNRMRLIPSPMRNVPPNATQVLLRECENGVYSQHWLVASIDYFSLHTTTGEVLLTVPPIAEGTQPPRDNPKEPTS